MLFLIADDDISTRLLLRSLIESNGDEVIEAENGKDALKKYLDNQDKIDVIVLDIIMPESDGIDCARQIRKVDIERNTPILFLTGMVKENLLQECFLIGNDVLLKPVSCVLASAKFESIKNNIILSRELKRKQDEIEAHHRKIKEENFLAMDIFNHFMKLNDTSSGNVRYHTSPTSTFNGDIFLAARSSMDTLYIFLGDLTGHGLPAAIAAIPINKIFFTMASKGIAISTIAKEINQTLYHLLPENIFCAGFLLEISSDGTQIKLWSGGMPSIMITNQNGILTDVIPCAHMPLGSQTPEEFESNIQTINLPKNSLMYLFTDGITDIRNKNGELFGEQGIRNIFSSPHEDGFIEIIKQVDGFICTEQSDDITLVEIKAKPLAWKTSCRENFTQLKTEKLKHALPWEISMRISGYDFQRGDPASQLIQFLSGATGIDMHQDTLSTILTELYSNALEHGLLKLDSKLKGSEDGFVDYYLQRSEGLYKLNNESDYVDIKVKFQHNNSNPAITISITDSGDGFDFNNVKPSNENELHGRGHKLLDSLCHELVYSNGGRTATATYQLLNPM